jgi:O-antigen/teichoic acid export membrane protein
LNAQAGVNRKLLGGVLGGVTFTAVGIAVSLLQFSILLRRLPIEQAGIWMIFANLGSYVLFLDLGLAPTLGRQISFAMGDPALDEVARGARINTLVRSCTTFVSVLALVVALFGAGGGWSYLRTIVPAALAAPTRSAWFVYVVGAALNLVGEGWFAGIYGLGHILAEKMIRSLGAMLGLLFMTVAVFSGKGFLALATAYVLQSACFLLMAKIVFSRLASPFARGSFDPKILKGLMVPSFKYAATLLGGILILQTDNVVIASMLGPAVVPNYQAVAKIVTILMSLSMMLVTTSSPHVSQAHARGDKTAVIHLLSRNLRFGLGVMVVLGTFIACFTDRFITAWLGPGHFVGFPIVWVLLAVMLLEAHHQAMASVTMATGRIAFLAPALIAGLLNLVFSVVLARRFGLIGVVFGTMTAQVLTNNWYVPWYTMRLFGIPWRRHVKTVLLPLAYLLVSMLVVGFSVRALTMHLSAVLSVAIGVLSTALAGAICFSVMFNTGERLAVLTKLRALASRQASILGANLPD